MPFVTFWQITADLPFSTGVPGGHGHKYMTEQVDGVVCRDAALRPHPSRPGQPQAGHCHRGLMAAPPFLVAVPRRRFPSPFRAAVPLVGCLRHGASAETRRIL